MHIKKIIIFINIILIIILFYTINKLFYKQSYNLINYTNISQDILWTYSFQKSWNELINYLNVDKIEFLDNQLSDNQILLNKKYSEKYIINDQYIYTKVSKQYSNLQKDIIKDVKNKFNTTPNLTKLDNFNNNGIIIYSMLKKDLSFNNIFSYKISFLSRFARKAHIGMKALRLKHFHYIIYLREYILQSTWG